LQSLWQRQYGALDAAVADAASQARELADDAQAVVDDARQVADQARQVAYEARDRAAAVGEAVTALRQSELPAAARREARLALERLAMDADAAVRRRAAEAMGEVADPAFMPVLVALLSDQSEVQVTAVVSLERIAGDRAPAPPGATHEQKVAHWQRWYRQKAEAGAEAGSTAEP
jgi:HEAT repeat protein